MKQRTLGTLVLLVLASGWGCTKQTAESTKTPAPSQASSQQRDKESTSVTVRKPIAGEAERTFSLSVPYETIALTQGMDQQVVIGINRGQDFREEVAIKMSELPNGVSVETTDLVIKPSSKEIKLMLKAANDAALGDFTIRITGHTASSGDDFSTDLKLNVKQK